LLKILSATNIINFFLFSIHLCILITEIPLSPNVLNLICVLQIN
jgi:hypothetical protein